MDKKRLLNMSAEDITESLPSSAR